MVFEKIIKVLENIVPINFHEQTSSTQYLTSPNNVTFKVDYLDLMYKHKYSTSCNRQNAYGRGTHYKLISDVSRSQGHHRLCLSSMYKSTLNIHVKKRTAEILAALGSSAAKHTVYRPDKGANRYPHQNGGIWPARFGKFSADCA